MSEINWQETKQEVPASITPKKRSGLWAVYAVAGACTMLLVAACSLVFSFFLGGDDAGV